MNSVLLKNLVLLKNCPVKKSFPVKESCPVTESCPVKESCPVTESCPFKEYTVLYRILSNPVLSKNPESEFNEFEPRLKFFKFGLCTHTV